MAFGIVWTKKAVDSYSQNIEYLKEDWTEKEIQRFLVLTKRKLEVLKMFPGVGIAQNLANLNVRCTVLHKKIKIDI